MTHSKVSIKTNHFLLKNFQPASIPATHRRPSLPDSVDSASCRHPLGFGRFFGCVLTMDYNDYGRGGDQESAVGGGGGDTSYSSSESVSQRQAGQSSVETGIWASTSSPSRSRQVMEAGSMAAGPTTNSCSDMIMSSMMPFGAEAAGGGVGSSSTAAAAAAAENVTFFPSTTTSPPHSNSNSDPSPLSTTGSFGSGGGGGGDASSATATASTTTRRHPIARACDRCHQRRLKCDGQVPCGRCVQAGVSSSSSVAGAMMSTTTTGGGGGDVLGVGGCTYGRPKMRKGPMPG